MFWQLVEEEGVKGVVSMNEDYELKWLANAKKVSLCVIYYVVTLQDCNVFQYSNFIANAIKLFYSV